MHYLQPFTEVLFFVEILAVTESLHFLNWQRLVFSTDSKNWIIFFSKQPSGISLFLLIKNTCEFFGSVPSSEFLFFGYKVVHNTEAVELKLLLMLLWNFNFITVLINACENLISMLVFFSESKLVFFFLKGQEGKPQKVLIKCSEFRVIALKVMEEAVSIERQSFSFTSYCRKLLHSILGSCNWFPARKRLWLLPLFVQQEECNYC